MTDQELHRILGEEPEVQPSGKFAARVMSAVRQDATMPPPMAFPWLCVLPLLCGWAVTLAAVVANVSGVPSGPAVQVPAGLAGVASVVGHTLAASHWTEGAWVVLTIALTYACVRYPLRLVSR